DSATCTPACEAPTTMIESVIAASRPRGRSQSRHPEAPGEAGPRRIGRELAASAQAAPQWPSPFEARSLRDRAHQGDGERKSSRAGSEKMPALFKVRGGADQPVARPPLAHCAPCPTMLRSFN